MFTEAALLSTEQMLDSFIAAFETGSLPKTFFTHAAHLTIGASYIHSLPFNAALTRMRQKVRSYNLAVGGQNTAIAGYHETLTRFWILALHHLHQAHASVPRLPFTQLAVQRYGSRRDLYADFYDFDVLASTHARAAWIPPTRNIDRNAHPNFL